MKPYGEWSDTKKVITCLAGVLVLLVGVRSLPSHPRPRSAWEIEEAAIKARVDAHELKQRTAREKGWEAALMSRHFVTEKLKAPATAEFQDSMQASVKEVDGIYSVISYVDAQNAYGAKLRSKYLCQMRDLGNGRWRLVELTML